MPLNLGQKAESVKHKIIFYWLTHCYLRRIGKLFPAHFSELMVYLTDNLTARQIMAYRYVCGYKFEAIAIEMNKDVRQVFRLHKQVIDNIIKQSS